MSFQSFVGVDLHKCTVTLTAVDAAGEISRLKISTKSTSKIESWLRALPAPVWMAVEACPFVEWFIDRFRPCVQRIDIADATELSNRRGKRRRVRFKIGTTAAWKKAVVVLDDKSHIDLF